MSDGKTIRKEKLELRNALTDDEKKNKSDSIIEKIIDFDEIKSAKNVFIYVHFRSEVRTVELIDKLMKMNKRISVPITDVQQKRINAVHITDMSKDLVPGYCNIPEPHPDILHGNITEPENLDVVILPGSVFDMRGGRMGYGGGYYDRFLEKIPYATRIGLAYEVQIVDEIALQPHDELLDYTVTEERIIEVPSRL
ncbi:MAG: 5-formyltetrahydrofolate cyclo-ligase [bacterium]